MKSLSLLLILFLSLILTTTQDSQEIINHENGIALHGYDAVSYFDGKPKKGELTISLLYEGITYLFDNTENLQKFRAKPDKYIPRYGGWCAYAIGSKGELVNVDPETFKIIDGRLYLFYNAYFNNTLKKWNMNEEELLKMADYNWDKLLKR